MTTTQESIGTHTESFAEGKALSADMRATTPAQMQALIQELDRVSKTAVDFRTSTALAEARVDPASAELLLDFEGAGVLAGTRQTYGVGRVAHQQVGERLEVPARYYRLMQEEAPGLLANNVNWWLSNKPRNALVRTLDGRVRAFLSDSYRILDNHDLFLHTGKAALAIGAVVQRLEMSDERFYMRLVKPDFAAKITGRGDDLKAKGRTFSSGYRGDNGRWGVADDDDPGGDWVFPAIIARNSEVGRGGLGVELGAFRATCSNYIVVGETLYQIHLGGRGEELGIVSPQTRRLKDAALWNEVEDMVKAAFVEEKWREVVARFNKAQADELDEPVEAVDAVVRSYGLSDDDKQAILNELVNPSFGVRPGATVWGLANAVTALAHKKPVEEAHELERAGGELLSDKGRELVAVRRKAAK